MSRYTSLMHYRAILLTLAISVVVPAAQAQMVAIEEDTGNLYAVTPTVGDVALTLIGGTGLSNVGALEFNFGDGTLYAMTTGETPSLYELQISPAWNDVTTVLLGELGVQYVFEGGLAFDPDGIAYGLNGGATVPLLFTIDLDTGGPPIVTDIIALDGRHDIAGLGWRSHDGLLVGLDSTTQTLLTIDPATGTTGLIKDLAPTTGSIGGMALLEEFGYFVTAGPGAYTPGSNELWIFDPLSGDHARVGDFDDVVIGAGFSGLAIVPEPATLGLLALGGLVLLRRRRA